MTARSTDMIDELRALSAKLVEVLAKLDGDTGENEPIQALKPFMLAKVRDDAGRHAYAASRPPLPEPRLVRRIIHQRQLRARFFPGDMFADPAWDMLLDLTAATAEGTRVSVTSLCIASGVPPTTALRWIAQMTEAGLVQRLEDHTDKRRAFIALSDASISSMARYFQAIGRGVNNVV